MMPGDAKSAAVVAGGGVRRVLRAALSLKQPVLAFPVTDLDTGAACKPRRKKTNHQHNSSSNNNNDNDNDNNAVVDDNTSGDGGGDDVSAHVTTTVADDSAVGSMQECVMLKPGSTVLDLFSAVRSGGGGGGGGYSESGGGGGVSSAPAGRGEFVRAECRDGPGGQRRRLLKRDEPLGVSNCVVKFYTNRKVSWQGGKGKAK